MPSNHLILCHPRLLLSSIFPSIRVFSNESALPIRWPNYWSFSFDISPSNELDGLPCSPPGDLPNPGIKPTCLTSLALAGGFFTTSATQEAHTEILYLLVPYRSKLYFPAVLILIYLFGCARALATTCRIFSCGMQTLSCGIFPVPSALRVWSLSHWTTRRIPSFILFQWPDSMFSDFIKETIISLLN